MENITAKHYVVSCVLALSIAGAFAGGARAYAFDKDVKHISADRSLGSCNEVTSYQRVDDLPKKPKNPGIPRPIF